jgi:hypothetical protein
VPPPPRLFPLVLVCALSLSIGWGIRGNFGHEEGAMIPGALAALAAVLLSGRADWWLRAAYFAFFGALGWAFGGSISYMWVIAYTHSGHLPSQGYGFACLFVIGFCWAALGGAGTALPACLDRERLTGLFPPILAVLFTWCLQDVLVSRFAPELAGPRRHESVLYWYDTSWLAALVAPAAVLALAAARGRFDWGTSLVLYLAAGWWAGFLPVVALVDGVGIEFRMTPPRGDNWAGAVGMTVAALIFFVRHRLPAAAYAMLVAGVAGGCGFVAAMFLKLAEVKYVPLALGRLFGEGAWQTNWHSVLEQTYGFFNGIGIALAMFVLARRLPPVADRPRTRRWTEVVAVAFVLLGVTYVNLVKDVGTWVRFHAVPPELYGLSPRAWFDIAYGLLALAVVALLVRHIRHRLAVVPESPLGQAQLFYVVFLWWVVIGNLMRAIPPFAPERLITEGVIHVNAVLCTVLVLVWPRATTVQEVTRSGPDVRSLYRVAAVGLVALAVSVGVATVGTRLIHGNAFVGHAGYHTRFGPDARTGKPQPGQPHP